MKIKIYKIPGAFMAVLPDGRSGTGNTWPEAIGALVAVAPGVFDVETIEYGDNEITRSFIIERGLDRRIV
jgi:hypothetical protein